MKDSNKLKQLFESSQSEILKKAEQLNSNSSFNIQELVELSNRYVSVVQEANLKGINLPNKFYDNYWSIFTELRIKAMVNALDTFYNLSVGMKLILNSQYNHGEGLSPDFGLSSLKTQSSETIEDHITETGEKQAGSNDCGLDNLESMIDRSILKKIEPFMKRGMSMAKICEIGRYSTATFYSRIRYAGIKPMSRGVYPVDEQTAAVYFKPISQNQSIGQDDLADTLGGSWMTIHEIEQKLNSSYFAVREMIKKHRLSFKTRKKGRSNYYLITEENLELLNTESMWKNAHGSSLTKDEVELRLTREFGNSLLENAKSRFFNEFGENGKEGYSKDKLDVFIDLVNRREINLG